MKERQSSDLIRVRLNSVSSINGLEADRRAIHEDIEVKCFYEGNATLLVGNETVTVGAGDVIVINPYEFHATVAYSENKGKYHLFMISPDYFADEDAAVSDLMLSLRTNRVFLRHHHKSNERIFDILMQAADEYKNGETACESVIRGLMLQLFALLLRAGTEDTLSNAPKESAHYKLIEPALRHIRDNYARSIDIDGLALMCGLSKHYFCHIFKAVTGQSAMVYLNDYRIKVANTLLMHTEKSVADIAEECGFEGTNYFCRRYKSFYGIPPGKHRLKKEII